MFASAVFEAGSPSIYRKLINRFSLVRHSSRAASIIMKLLCISNGHGEDVIALRILSALRRHQPQIEISALPISGEGRPYQGADIPIIGPTRVLPSGGFLNREAAQLARDVEQGLISLTRSQLSAIKNWSAAGDFVLAVGDIVPLIFAHRSGLPYAFVGTAKSEYWLRDETGKLPRSSASSKWQRFEGWSGSVYLPWERWLMARPRCRAVFVRDAFTAKTLQPLGVAAHYEGNPMMDGLESAGKLVELLQPLRSPIATSESSDKARATALYVSQQRRSTIPLTVALITGSRPPEAYENWANILAAIPSLLETFRYRTLIFLSAIAPSLSLERLQAALANAGWTEEGDRSYPTYKKQNATLLLVGDAYSDCLQEAQIAIATAGTATEQFVGLGKPAVTLPGSGPQFTTAFATVQAKMLGASIQMVTRPEEVGPVISRIISDPDRLQTIDQNGKHRMGEPGAGERIAARLWEVMSDE